MPVSHHPIRLLGRPGPTIWVRKTNRYIARARPLKVHFGRTAPRMTPYDSWTTDILKNDPVDVFRPYGVHMPTSGLAGYADYGDLGKFRLKGLLKVALPFVAGVILPVVGTAIVGGVMARRKKAAASRALRRQDVEAQAAGITEPRWYDPITRVFRSTSAQASKMAAARQKKLPARPGQERGWSLARIINDARMAIPKLFKLRQMSQDVLDQGSIPSESPEMVDSFIGRTMRIAATARKVKDDLEMGKRTLERARTNIDIASDKIDSAKTASRKIQNRLAQLKVERLISGASIDVSAAKSMLSSLMAERENILSRSAGLGQLSFLQNIANSASAWVSKAVSASKAILGVTQKAVNAAETAESTVRRALPPEDVPEPTPTPTELRPPGAPGRGMTTGQTVALVGAVGAVLLMATMGRRGGSETRVVRMQG